MEDIKPEETVANEHGSTQLKKYETLLICKQINYQLQASDHKEKLCRKFFLS